MTNGHSKYVRIMVLIMIFAALVAASSESTSPHLQAHQLRIGHHHGPFVSHEIPQFSWKLRCSSPEDPLSCRGLRQASYQVRVLELEQRKLVYDSKRVSASTPVHEVAGRRIKKLRSDREYLLRVSVWSTNSTSTTGEQVPITAALAFQTALLEQDDFQGEWIGGFTELRSSFAATGKAISRATAYASGVGCFSMSINGQPTSNTTFMSPGWSFVPTVRVLYEAVDVAHLLTPNGNNDV